jgi:hypothetical protein
VGNASLDSLRPLCDAERYWLDFVAGEAVRRSVWNLMDDSQSLKLASKVVARKIKASRPDNPGIHGDFSLSYAPFENA